MKKKRIVLHYTRLMLEVIVYFFFIELLSSLQVAKEYPLASCIFMIFVFWGASEINKDAISIEEEGEEEIQFEKNPTDLEEYLNNKKFL